MGVVFVARGGGWDTEGEVDEVRELFGEGGGGFDIADVLGDEGGVGDCFAPDVFAVAEHGFAAGGFFAALDEVLCTSVSEVGPWRVRLVLCTDRIWENALSEKIGLVSEFGWDIDMRLRERVENIHQSSLRYARGQLCDKMSLHPVFFVSKCGCFAHAM